MGLDQMQLDELAIRPNGFRPNGNVPKNRPADTLLSYYGKYGTVHIWWPESHVCDLKLIHVFSFFLFSLFSFIAGHQMDPHISTNL